MKVRFRRSQLGGYHFYEWYYGSDPDTCIVGPLEETKKKAKKALKKMVAAAYLELHPEIKEAFDDNK